MASIGEDLVSLLESAIPTSTTSSLLTWAFILALASCAVFYASPIWFTDALIAALHETEETHLRAIEAGIISGSDSHTKLLTELQMKVSLMREATLCSSLSDSHTLWDLAKGHPFALLQCIWEVQSLKTRIEVSVLSILFAGKSVMIEYRKILQEKQLRQRAGSRGRQILFTHGVRCCRHFHPSAKSEKEKCRYQLQLAVNQGPSKVEIESRLLPRLSELNLNRAHGQGICKGALRVGQRTLVRLVRMNPGSPQFQDADGKRTADEPFERYFGRGSRDSFFHVL
ncbi:hypothetical protein C8R47DRAFT_1063747 [Mycena vitilis]|nr:hypothetical protein C8R47DRAFT_1063747 [Mycena vitilis]